MILRNYLKGEQLDVAGLNRITVLLDRSETHLTEIGYNVWPEPLDGPPHRHEDKDQVFLVLEGSGAVRIGETEYPASRGSMLHLPSGVVHQTINRQTTPLGYLLLNIFNDPSKEGHGTFKDHIDKMKMVRRAQADNQDPGYDAGTATTVGVLRSETSWDNLSEAMSAALASGQAVPLLGKADTHRFELAALSLASGKSSTLDPDSGVERSLYVFNGSGEAEVDGESSSLKAGDLLYLAPGSSLTIAGGETPLELLCLHTHLKAFS
jgi:mannose-6-phosphate isomerase-like protein (cupin superfamily)